MLGELRTAIRNQPRLAWLRLARLNLLARSIHQDPSDLIATDAARWWAAIESARDGKRVLVATNTGGHFGVAAIDRLLCVALSMRGANVTTLLCDGALPACQMCEINLLPDVARFAANGPPGMLCDYCHGAAAKVLRPLGLTVHGMGDFLSDQDRQEAVAFAQSLAFDRIPAATWAELPVGEHALAGTLRYFASASLRDEKHAEAVLRRFCAASVLAVKAFERLFERHRPEVVVAHHGIYVPQGPIAALARARGIRVVTWNPAYRRKCFIFSHDDTYHHTLMNEPTSAWCQAPLDEPERAAIERYLHSRREGSQDWIRFHKNEADSGDLSGLGLDPSKPMIAAFTNVFWDAQLHYPSNAFASQSEWLLDTVDWFARRPDLQLVIRVHPAELTGSPPSREPAAAVLRRAYPRLPDNVRLVGPESAVSSYVLAERSNTALIYATKMGVELSALGIPVIVAGEAWVRNKGVTEDVVSRAHYRQLLDALPAQRRLDPARRERALHYAHYFFFRRMIPLAAVEPNSGPRRFSIAARHLGELASGSDPGLDAVCDGILDGSPFHYPQ